MNGTSGDTTSITGAEGGINTLANVVGNSCGFRRAAATSFGRGEGLLIGTLAVTICFNRCDSCCPDGTSRSSAAFACVVTAGTGGGEGGVATIGGD